MEDKNYFSMFVFKYPFWLRPSGDKKVFLLVCGKFSDLLLDRKKENIYCFSMDFIST